MTNELIDLYEENEKLALQSSLFRRKTLCKNEKRHEQMSKELDNLIKEGKASSTHAERLLRNIRIVEEMIGKQKGEIPDIDVQYKNLLKLFTFHQAFLCQVALNHLIKFV